DCVEPRLEVRQPRPEAGGPGRLKPRQPPGEGAGETHRGRRVEPDMGVPGGTLEVTVITAMIRPPRQPGQYPLGVETGKRLRQEGFEPRANPYHQVGAGQESPPGRAQGNVVGILARGEQLAKHVVDARKLPDDQGLWATSGHYHWTLRVIGCGVRTNAPR